jgi:hypothetical protein
MCTVLYYCHWVSTQLQLNISYHKHRLFHLSKWDLRTEIYLRPTVQYGFNCAHFQETHNYSINFWGEITCAYIYSNGGGCRKYGEIFIYVLKLHMSFTVSIFTKITNAPWNQEGTFDLEFHWNRPRYFVSTGAHLRPSVIYDWHYADLTFWRRNYFFNFSTHCI